MHDVSEQARAVKERGRVAVPLNKPKGIGYENPLFKTPHETRSRRPQHLSAHLRHRAGPANHGKYVTGALALLKAKVPTDSYLGTIYRLLSGVRRIDALEGKVTSGGLLNLNNALKTATQVSPDNDNLANRQTLTGAATTVYGRNLGATKETGEPNHAGNAGGASVWYSWTAPHSGVVEVTTAKSVTSVGASWNTLLAVYTGSSVSALTLQAGNDDSGISLDGSGTSRLTFNATSGTTYQIAEDGFGGASGFIRLAISYAPQNDNLAGAYKLNGPCIAFEGTTLDATKEASEPNHAGVAGGRSVWWSWKAPVTGTVVLTTAGSTFDTLLSVYTGSSYPLTYIASNNDDPDPVLKDQYGGSAAPWMGQRSLNGTRSRKHFVRRPSCRGPGTTA